MHASVLRYIDQVARSGSIRRAALELNVAASAVNRQVLNLEAELGCALFERLSSGVKPTPAGEILLKHVRRTLTDWRNTTGGIAALTDEISGEVRIVALPPLIVSVLISVVGKLTNTYEKVSFVVLASDGTKSAEQMQIGYPDIALLPFDKRYNNYVVVDTLEMKLGAVVSPDHALAKRQNLTFSECAEHPAFLLYDNWVRGHSDNEFRFTGAKFAPRIQANSWTFVRKMIEAGNGVGFLTPVGIMDQLESGELVFIPVEMPEHENSKLSIYVHRDRCQSSEVIVAVNEIRDSFQRVRDLLVRLDQERQRSL
ncbi:MAG: LysR family transcriptional regulator [Rhizobiaceae bacterium]|nr:LysR family transcriptional regulator [Rhizobiaceae bacterium]